MRGAHVPCRATGLGDDQTQRCEIVDEGAEMAGRAARRSGQPRRALRHAAAAPGTVVEVGVDPAERLFGGGRAPPSMAPTAAAGRSPHSSSRIASAPWELAIKQALGNLRAPRDLAGRSEQDGFRGLPVTLFHTEHVGGLPAVNGDPSDRLLVAQAQVEGLPIVTSDGVIPYAVQTMSAEH